MEAAARRNDSRGVYRQIATIKKPVVRAEEPLFNQNGDLVTNEKEKAYVWKEHFDRLLNAGKEMDDGDKWC